MKKLLGVSLALFVFAFFSTPTIGYAQDSLAPDARPFTHAESLLVDSMFSDLGIVMPDSVPRTRFFGNLCSKFLYNNGASDTARIYFDLCRRGDVSDSVRIVRARLIDVRPGRLRRVLLVIVVTSETLSPGSEFRSRCEIWYDEGFRRPQDRSAGEPSGTFGHFFESSCHATAREFDDRIDSLMHQP